MKTWDPWRTGNGRDCAPSHAICEGAAIIARVTGCGYPIGTGWSPQSQGRANLLAAAPRLLNALQTLVRARDISVSSQAVLDSAYDEARAAIADATRPVIHPDTGKPVVQS